MRSMPTTLVSIAILVALAAPASAHSVSGAYTLASTPGLSVVCSPNCVGTGLNLGGFRFPANGEIPTSVAIADASARPVGFTVCQDLNADNVCGNQNPSVGPIEPQVAGCGTGASLAGKGFVGNQVTSVFVRMIDNTCPGNVATNGVITLTYAT